MNKIIDLRSDTVTMPSAGMLKAMSDADAGDMVFGEDPSVNRLEKTVGEMFGWNDAVFCPTGTMTNQIAVKVHTSPGDEIICSNKAHIYINEGGGLAFHSGVQVSAIDTENGTFTSEQAADRINPDDPHKARTRIISIENTMNRGGGKIWENDNIVLLSELCRSNGLKFHLDGARIFNACVAIGTKPAFFGKHFDSVSVCLSKGLGAPVGSVLTGNDEFVSQARRLRKLMGGTMRQAGYMAAAGIYALNNNIERLSQDHFNAAHIGSTLSQCTWVDKVMPVESNIIIIKVKKPHSAVSVNTKLRDHGILAGVAGTDLLRMVTHLDISESMAKEVCKKLIKLKFR